VADTALAIRLHELIAAIDRRRPRPDRPGEAAIARDAAGLRAAAVARLAQMSAAELPTRS
jgi:hypothetical protein